jgi:CBS domain-containing protein
MTGSLDQPTHGSYLLPHFEHATVADAMHPGILSCDPDATLTEVARMMSTHHVHCIVVIGAAEGGSGESRLRGIVSDLDLLKAGMRADDEETAATLAAKPMKPMVTVETTMPLRSAAELMLEHGASHAVVMNPEVRRPIGILSTLDIAGVLAWGEL